MKNSCRLLLALLLCGLCGCASHGDRLPTTDRDRLLALHAEVMQAHRLNDVELILRAESEDYVVGNRGEISHPTLEERRARLGPYLRSTQFTEYIDVVPPIVAVSRDGSLGWVIVQVRARGTQSVDGALQPISFEFAWIELYEKRRGTWLRIGNLSNVKP